LSIALFDYVETLNYDKAHLLAAGLVGFSLLAMVLIQWLTKNRATGHTEDPG
jgi:molybdate transport system permease protein